MSRPAYRYKIRTPSGFIVPGPFCEGQAAIPKMLANYTRLMGESWKALSERGYTVIELEPRRSVSLQRGRQK